MKKKIKMLEEKVEEKNKPQGKHSKLMPHKFDYWGDILEENKYAWRCHTCHALEFTKKDEIKIEKYDDIGEDGAPYLKYRRSGYCKLESEFEAIKRGTFLV